MSFNAYGHKELEEELNKLEDKAGDVEVRTLKGAKRRVLMNEYIY